MHLRNWILLTAAINFSSLASAKLNSIDLPQSGGLESVVVQRLSDSKVLLESSARQTLSPASVTKIITSAALLRYFGPKHTFKTKFYTSGSRKNGIISGSLYIKGDGDPLITNEKLWQLAADLKNMGIRSVSGDLIIDNSLFDSQKRDRSRTEGTLASDRAYDAPISAFGVNFNTLPIAIAPASQLGEKALVSIDPYHVPEIEIVNQATTVSGNRHDIAASRHGNGRESKIIVTGNIGQKASLVKTYRSMGDAVYEGGELLRSFLLAVDIKIDGQTKEGLVPAGAELVYTLESYDLGFIVQGLNHYSNNYLADMLVKRLGAAFSDTKNPDQKGSGSLSSGTQVLQRFMREDVGIKDPFELYNGSGLDHRNRLSAQQIVAVLAFMHRHIEWYPEFLVSFPTAGWSGTLENRFKTMEQESLHGLVRAKTGTLTQPVAASSLAGFFGHPKHGLLAFAIINNGKPSGKQPSVSDFRSNQDQALLELLKRL